MQKLSLGFKLLSFVLLVSVGDAQGMEVIEIIPSLCKPLSSIFSSLSSLLPSSYTNQKSEKLNTQRLKANKNDFEQALDSLKNDSWAEKAHLSVLSTLRNQDYDLTYFKANAHVILVNATRNPINFLFYCYYQKYHNDWDRTDIDFLVEPKHEDLFNSCKNARVDGYSALSAAIAAKDIAIESKRAFIQKLIDNGFELTEKDTLLAAAEFSDGMLATQKIAILSLLLGEGNLSVLPYDVKKYTMDYVIDDFKETLWPLFNVHSKHAA